MIFLFKQVIFRFHVGIMLVFGRRNLEISRIATPQKFAIDTQNNGFKKGNSFKLFLGIQIKVQGCI